ncbi:alcohol dehydrogenase catalytic domain-containing protein [Actinocrispum wychmicini]|nr:alcohol dehydrogenase catalytic domain-containing protein [Actinocrispum wychmicini]
MPTVAEPGDAVVRVTRSAICGTDLHPYRGELPDFAAGTVLGHEFTGVVVEAGVAASVKPGQRVVGSDIVACGRCPMCIRGWHYQCADVTLFGYSTVVGRSLGGAQAEYVLVPHADVVLAEIPDDLTDEQALFTGDVLATGYQATLAAGMAPGDTVVVVGGGAVGLTAGLCLRVTGAGAIVIAELAAERRQAAAQLGFLSSHPDELPGLVAQLTRGAGAPVVVEAVGTDAALGLALSVAGPQATVVSVGAHHGVAFPFPTGAAFARELTVKFVVGNPIRVRDTLFRLIASGRLDPTAVVSHRLPLTDVVNGYDLFDRQEATKVVLVHG